MESSVTSQISPKVYSGEISKLYKNDIDATFNQGKLMVHLDNVKYDAPYLIVNIGPVINNYYDWVATSIHKT